MRKPYRFKESQRLWAQTQRLMGKGGQFSRLPRSSQYPVYFERAKGCRMWDVDGNEFLDLLCGIGPIILGYAYKRVDDAAREVMKTSFQSSMNHPLQLELAKLLIKAVPCAQSARIFKTGTEATVAAARLARLVTKRRYIARCGYHGWADMWMDGKHNGTDKGAWESVRAFNGTAEGLETLFRKSRVKYAAVIICPADTKPFTQENYQDIVDVAHKHGALAIFDEVKSGFRVSLGGAQELLGVTPDLTTLSKGLGNGYPIAALVGKRQYMDRVWETGTSGTFSVEALSIAASIAVLKELKEKNVVAHLWKIGQRLIDGLNEICRAHGMEQPRAYADPVPSMVRFMWKPHTSEFRYPPHLYFFNECCRYGLFFTNWHVAFVNYSHKNRDIDQALEICDFVMGKTKRKFGK